MQKQPFSWPVIVLLTIITVLLAGVLYMLFLRGGISGVSNMPTDTTNTSDSSAKGSEFTAVFLTNGQAYFGKLTEGEDADTLTDVYYISAAPQSPDGATADSKNNVSLVKLGSEVHGPTDEMRINRSQIMFTETLREDSQVVKAIASEESGQ